MDREKQLREQAKALEIGAKAASGTAEAETLRQRQAEVVKQLAEIAAGAPPDLNDDYKQPSQAVPRVAGIAAQPGPYQPKIDELGERTTYVESTEAPAQALGNLDVAPEPQQPIPAVAFTVSAPGPPNTKS